MVIEYVENISDNDSIKLNKLLGCIHELWDETRKKGQIIRIVNGEQIFDNFALDRFISDLTLLLDDINSHRSIRDYIAGSKVRFNIEVPLEP